MTTDTVLVHHVVCIFTPKLLLDTGTHLPAQRDGQAEWTCMVD